ncbi:hypothetical protein TNCV_3615541 [Trichonephila clavipes]|nr:hypothetical protein TNCV_3615541 [Trichonephila clavipes]
MSVILPLKLSQLLLLSSKMACLPQLLRCKRFSTLKQQMVTIYKELGYVNPSVLYLVLESAWFCSLAGDGGRGNRWLEPMG